MKIGLVDADLLDKGTRHPNLALMKISSYYKENKIECKLIFEDIDEFFDIIYISKVFTFTKEPYFKNVKYHKILRGGTGYYIDEEKNYLEKRIEDLYSLDKLFNYKLQFPDYSLYENWLKSKQDKGEDIKYYKDYYNYSIGFLTKGCIRKCSFCVNRYEKEVFNYSPLNTFLDKNKPYIYLWDDNFLASKNWKVLLKELQDTNKYFQFKQGLDIRLLTEEKAKMLSESKYYGDFIFAFDNYKDKDIIISKLNIWNKYCYKTTKFYLFCGYKINNNDDLFIKDIIELFKRIEILMNYKCLGYVMRHADYTNHPLNNIYIQIARWVNQPWFFKKMSFKEFCYYNQKSIKSEFYKCQCIVIYEKILEYFSNQKDELEYYFNLKFNK